MTMTHRQKEALAAVLYRHFQGEMEELDIHRLAARSGSFDEANHYTQRMFREAAKVVEDGIEEMGTEAAP
jgi:hypothetical protein